MEYELRALRNQLAEKSKHFLQLQKKVTWIQYSLYTYIFSAFHDLLIALNSHISPFVTVMYSDTVSHFYDSACNVQKERGKYNTFI